MANFNGEHLLKLVDHPLAGFLIALGVALYYPLVLRVGTAIFAFFSKTPIMPLDPLRHFRMLGSELSTISVVAMAKAILDATSPLGHSVRQQHPEHEWVCYLWVILFYVVLIFSPAIFVRFALLEHPAAASGKRSEASSLFLWRWTLVSWVLGFVNLHISFKLME